MARNAKPTRAERQRAARDAAAVANGQPTSKERKAAEQERRLAERVSKRAAVLKSALIPEDEDQELDLQNALSFPSNALPESHSHDVEAPDQEPAQRKPERKLNQNKGRRGRLTNSGKGVFDGIFQPSSTLAKQALVGATSAARSSSTRGNDSGDSYSGQLRTSVAEVLGEEFGETLEAMGDIAEASQSGSGDEEDGDMIEVAPFQT